MREIRITTSKTMVNLGSLTVILMNKTIENVICNHSYIFTFHFIN